MPGEAIATHKSANAQDRKAEHRPLEAAGAMNEWAGFSPGRWQQTIDVRDFIQQNVTPYDGDEGFLVGPSERTKAVWEKLQPFFKE